MSQYIGFSTQNANKPKTTNARLGYQGGPGTILSPVITGKKYRLTDQNLVIQDFINALNIRQGEKVGQPEYGTTLWGFIFDQNTPDLQSSLEQEVRRIATQDPRLILNYVKVYTRDNGILLEVQASIAPFIQSELLSIFFDAGANNATIA